MSTTYVPVQNAAAPLPNFTLPAVGAPPAVLVYTLIPVLPLPLGGSVGGSIGYPI